MIYDVRTDGEKQIHKLCQQQFPSSLTHEGWKKTEKYPVKLRVTFQRVPEYYQTIFDLSKEEGEKLSASRISNELQQIREKLRELEWLADSAVKEFIPLSFPEFEKTFIKSHPYIRQKREKRDHFYKLTCIHLICYPFNFRPAIFSQHNK
jgi:hypothetical protein